MTGIPSISISREAIQAGAAAESFEVGEAYHGEGRVVDVARAPGGGITGRVRGSRYVPYEIEITLDGGAIESARCDCPRYSGAWCRHIVAVLVECSRADGDLRAVIRAASREELEALLMELAEKSDQVAERVRGLAGD